MRKVTSQGFPEKSQIIGKDQKGEIVQALKNIKNQNFDD